jgi:hypothetical protein
MADSNIQVPDACSYQKLQAMEFVAKMKAAADHVNAGFIGGFITAKGEKFIMTNFSDQTDIDDFLSENLK